MKPTKTYRPQTLAVRGGQTRTSEGEHSEAIFATSSFVFDNAAHAQRLFSNQQDGNIYSRFTNPTVKTFEQRLALMEGGESCVATASGMSAMLCLCMSLLQAGDHVVASRSIFGASYTLLNQLLAKFGIQTTFVDLTNNQAWSDAVKKNTKLFFLETPSNPMMEVADIAGISSIAHNSGFDIKVVVDNCFCTPVLQRPLEHGADIVMHSATKFIDGQGRCVGGAVVADRQTTEAMVSFMRTAGPTMSPFNAWVFAKSLETLDLRVNKASDNALWLAEELQTVAQVNNVFYPGLSAHPQHALCLRQQSKAGAVVSFEVQGGQVGAWALIDSVELISRTSNLGDTRTTITHPYTTTHARWSDQEKALVGITPSLIRIAVGLEDPQDIVEDLNF